MSMHVVWKYELPLVYKFTLDLPENCLILTIHHQGDNGFMWVQCDPEATTEKRRFIAAGTGHKKIDGKYMKYIGTYFERDFVWHIYEDTKR